MGPMQMTQLPQHIQAAAFPPAVTPMPQRPAFYPPMLYWYPSPPVSPQTFFTHPGPCAIVMRGLPYNVTVTDVVNYFQGFPEVGRKNLGRMNTLCRSHTHADKLSCGGWLSFWFWFGGFVACVPAECPNRFPVLLKPPWLSFGVVLEVCRSVWVCVQFWSLCCLFLWLISFSSKLLRLFEFF